MIIRILQDLESVRNVVSGFGDARMRIIKTQGRIGVSAARNSGVRAAAGEVLAFLDDDDYWLPGKIAAQLELFVPGVVGVDCGYIEKDDTWRLSLKVIGDGKVRNQAEMISGYCPTSAKFFWF